MAKYVSDSNLQKVLQSTKKYVDDKFVDTVITNSLSISRKADTTIGQYSVALGFDNTASGNYSFAEGRNNTASSNQSHAEGYGSTASGINSHAEGKGTIASSDCQHVEGMYNISDTNSTYVHIVGNGESGNARSNAHTLDWSGNAWYAGKVTAGAAPTEDNDLTTKKYVDDQIVIVDTDLNDAMVNIFGAEYSIL